MICLAAAAAVPFGAWGQEVGARADAQRRIRSSRVTVYGASVGVRGVLENSDRDGTITGASSPSPDGLRIFGPASEVFLRWDEFDSVRVRRDHPFFTDRRAVVGTIGLLGGGLVAAAVARDRDGGEVALLATVVVALGHDLAREVGMGARDTVLVGGRPAVTASATAAGAPVVLLRTTTGTTPLLPGMTLVLDRVPYCLMDEAASHVVIVALGDSGLRVRGGDGREGVLLLGALDVGLVRPSDLGVIKVVVATLRGATGGVALFAGLSMMYLVSWGTFPPLTWVRASIALPYVGIGVEVAREVWKARELGIAYGRVEGSAAPPPLPEGACPIRWALAP